MKSSNPWKPNGLPGLERAGSVVLVILTILVACVVLATPIRGAVTSNEADILCQMQAPLANPINPCPLLEQANSLMARLTRSAAEYARKVSAGFDPERSLRIQEALLREDLVWLSRGFSRQQMDLMVFVSVAFSLEHADARSVELRNSFAANGDPNDQVRLQRIDLYRSEALQLLDELSASVGTVSDSNLRFHF
ncbi:MAG: hypothetical protein ACRD1X_05120 [Vicinamibacteria bacterium]